MSQDCVGLKGQKHKQAYKCDPTASYSRVGQVHGKC